MSTCVPNLSEVRAEYRHANRTNRSGGFAQSAERAAEDLVTCPAVRITSSEPVKRLGFGSDGWFSESIHVPLGCKVDFSFRATTHLLVLYNEGVRKNGDTSIDGLNSKLRSFARKLTFVPAGSKYHEWHETGSYTQLTFFYLYPSEFQGPNEGYGDGFPPRLYFEDSPVFETASKLKNVIECGQAGRLPYVKALSAVLAHELSRVDEQFDREPTVTRGGLAGWQKRAVVDYIEEHLGEQVCLSTLAGLTRLSLHHFCRAFKQSFGIPAYQYQVRRRMEAAKLYLADRSMSVTDVGLSLGYAQTSSFTTAFRKMTGWTPMVYRREFEGAVAPASRYARPDVSDE